MNRMLDPLGFDAALKKADFPQPIRTGLKRLFDQLSINGLPLDRDDPLRRTRTGAQGSHPAKRGPASHPL